MLVLAVRDVSKRLAGRDVLTSVSFDCDAGETCVILGSNGSGKSTLLRIVVGLVEADRGWVEIEGVRVDAPSGRARQRLGYLPDATDVLPELSVGELVALVRTFKGDARHAAAVPALRERLGLDALWRQRLGTLSFGQRKRALLMAALIGAPSLLVLDEPTNGIDAAGAELIMSMIAERRGAGEATVLATNDPHFAASLDATSFELASARLSPVARGTR